MGTTKVKEEDYRALPYVNENGIWEPLSEYDYGKITPYRCIMTKEMFQEAYYEFIKKEGLA